MTGKPAHFQLDDPPAIARVVARAAVPEPEDEKGQRQSDETQADNEPTARVAAPAPTVLDAAAPHAAHLDVDAPEVRDDTPADVAPSVRTSIVDDSSDRPADVAATDLGWGRVAKWYDRLLEERTSDLYAEVVLPERSVCSATSMASVCLMSRADRASSADCLPSEVAH